MERLDFQIIDLQDDIDYLYLHWGDEPNMPPPVIETLNKLRKKLFFLRKEHKEKEFKT